MVFSSLVFLYLFLPLTLLLYYAAPRRLRNPVLLVMSLLFYGWGEPRGVVIMLITCIVNFACAKTIYQHPDSPRLRKAALIVSVVVSLGILGYFKYAGFAAENLPFIAGLGLPAVALPIGISFYTFQAMSCTIDVYRGKVDAAPGFIGYTTYVTLFPQLIAGPIVRYQQIADQLIHRRESADRFAAGVGTFVCGLCKKVLLANQFGALFDQVQAMEAPSALSALFGLLCYTMQIYFDFSGYSDLAIGLGRFFGFELPVNFNYPYISRSITEFWRRWHISLGMWFREYVYI
ncbi:MAG: MBOAT family protein, partial [Firmicutes bacterium]|nr:MBOAT family protein [Bacillota bacterium]